MAAPLDGIRVLEVSNWLAAPSAAALMQDLGADVVKVEPPTGDIFRHFPMRSIYPDFEFALQYAFEFDNRGKQSIVIALDQPGGPELVRRLAADVDIFVTNLTQPRRERYGLTDGDVLGVNPSLVYVSLTGYGTKGPDAARAGFDYSAFWARSGIMGTLGEPPSPPPLNRGGQGDHTTALNMLAATLAALRMRDAGGEGQVVEVTLQATGMWTIGADISAALVANQQPPRHDRTQPPNPIWNSYPTSDERWVLLVMPQPDPYWGAFCAAVGEPGWEHDERYYSLVTRLQNSAELVTAIEERFALHDLAYWGARLDEFGLIWAPVASLQEVVADPQVEAMDLFAEIEHPQAGTYRTLKAPFTIRGAETDPKGPAPTLGEHTQEVLAAHGLNADEIAELASRGIFG